MTKTKAKETERPWDAVVCDLDGVIRLWGTEMADAEREFDLDPGVLAGAAFEPGLLGAAVTGALSDEQWRARTGASLVGACGGLAKARALIARWSEKVGRADPEMVELIALLRRGGTPVVLLSNATTRLESDLRQLGLDGAFDAVVNTAREGVAKPDPEVFRIAAQRAGAKPERCVFVDDTAAHLAGADAVGMGTVRYVGAGPLRKELAPLLDG
jgi:putative hydrolase of the HAD superfamily